MNDCFIHFDQVLGESDDRDHKGAIIVNRWKWGVDWQSVHNQGGKYSGKGDVQTFTFVHNVDTASPALMARCVNGKEIPTGKLTMRRAGGLAQLYIVIKFDRVRLLNVNLTHGFDSGIPEETVTFSFQRVAYEYAAQSEHGGTKGGWVPFLWDAKLA